MRYLFASLLIVLAISCSSAGDSNPAEQEKVMEKINEINESTDQIESEIEEIDQEIEDINSELDVLLKEL